MKSFANPQIQNIEPYQPPIENRKNFDGLLLDFNETTAPMSPLVKTALLALIENQPLRIYPEYGDLCSKIAEYAGVSANEVLVTNGSDQGIDLIFRTFTQKGDSVIIPSPSFAMFEQCAGIAGNAVLRPLYQSNDFPFDEILRLLKTQTIKFLVICNPNNPTGTLLSLENIESLVKSAALTRTIVYVDEAYFEFSGITAVPLLQKYGNLIITRTFSKAFGLAALRVGYIIAQKTILQELQKVRGPYDVNMLASEAAKLALSDVDFLKNTVREVMTLSKPLLENFFRENNIPFFESGANFLLFRPNRDPATVFEILKRNGILVRPRSGPNIEGTLRVTVGSVSEIQRFIAVYRKNIL